MQVLQKDPTSSDCFVQDEACGIRPATEQAVKTRRCQSFWLSVKQDPTFPLCTISKPQKDMFGAPAVMSSFEGLLIPILILLISIPLGFSSDPQSMFHSGRPKFFGGWGGTLHIQEGATLLQVLLPLLTPNLSTQLLDTWTLREP